MIKGSREKGFSSPPVYIWSNEEFSLGAADNLIGIRSAAVSQHRRIGTAAYTGDLSWFTRDRDAGYPVIES